MGKIPLEVSTIQPVTNLRKAAEDLGAGNAGNGAGSPSLPASTESRTPATSRSPRSPNDRRRDSNNDQELPGIKPVPRVRLELVSEVVNQHTELEHTPKPTFTNKLFNWNPFVVGERGLPPVCSRGVL